MHSGRYIFRTAGPNAGDIDLFHCLSLLLLDGLDTPLFIMARLSSTNYSAKITKTEYYTTHRDNQTT